MEHLKCDFDFRLVYENGVMDIVRYVQAGEVGGGVLSRICSSWFGKTRHVGYHFLYIYLKVFSIARKFSDLLPKVCAVRLKIAYYFVQLKS
jgi:hypothetical protein